MLNNKESVSTDKQGTYPAGEASLLVVRGHAQGLHEELHGLVDAVLVVETQAAHVQRVRVGRLHPQDVTGDGGERGEDPHETISEPVGRSLALQPHVSQRRCVPKVARAM